MHLLGMSHSLHDLTSIVLPDLPGCEQHDGPAPSINACCAQLRSLGPHSDGDCLQTAVRGSSSEGLLPRHRVSPMTQTRDSGHNAAEVRVLQGRQQLQACPHTRLDLLAWTSAHPPQTGSCDLVQAAVLGRQQ